MTTQERQQTSVSNIEYDLVSAIYHSLQSALSASVYMTDAQWIGDQELSQFFWNNQQENRRAADHAEYLLNKRLGQMQGQQQGQPGQSQTQGQQQGQFGQSQYNPGQYGYGWNTPGMYGQGQYGYGWNTPGMYSGGYGWNYPGMYGGQYGGMGMGGGMYGGGTPTLRQVTGTSDVTYDLISTIYHSLETAQTIQTYMQDVQQTGDQEISQFFQQIHQQANRCAQQAQRLLAPRLSQKRMFQGGQYGSGSSQGSQSGQTSNQR